MKKKQTLFIHGAIAGIAIVSSWFIGHWLSAGSEPDFAVGEIIGYAAMIIALSLVFFGVKSYRDHQKDGIISFKDAFFNGLVIVLVASIFYVIGWEVYYPNFMPDFAEDYSSQQVAALVEEGLSESEISERKEEMDKWMDQYRNPLIRMPMTFMEIFPVGLLIALFSALVLKKKSA